MTKDEWAVIALLRERFTLLWTRSGAVGSPDPVFADICRRYREMGRHYHTLLHLVQCLRELDAVRHYAQDVDAIEFFIFYHDIIYSFSRKDNEKKSAIHFVHVARKALLPDAFTYKVSRMIIASKHHRTETSGCDDFALALDIDMSILGADPSVYDEYAKDIRDEYRSTYSDKEFTMGRLGWIKTMLDLVEKEHQHIFLTGVFQEKYEERAIANLKNEAVELQNRH